MHPALDCGCGTLPTAQRRPCARTPRDLLPPQSWRPAPAQDLDPWPCGLCLRLRTTPLFPPSLRRNFLLGILFLLLLIPHSFASDSPVVIQWTIGDPMFSTTNDTVLYVKKDDQMTFRCPRDDPRIRIFWSYSRGDFEDCVLKNKLFECSVTKDFQLQVTEYQWLPGMPSFLPNKPVYFLVYPGKYCKHFGMRVVAVIGTKPTAPSIPARPRPPITTRYQTQPPTKWRSTPKEPLVKRQQMEHPITTSAAKNSVSVSKAGRTFSSSPALSACPLLLALALCLSWR